MGKIVKRPKGKSAARGRRHLRLRKKVVGTEARPRLVVTRSARHVFVQVVDDSKGVTVASASTDAATVPEPDHTPASAVAPVETSPVAETVVAASAWAGAVVTASPTANTPTAVNTAKGSRKEKVNRDMVDTFRVGDPRGRQHSAIAERSIRYCSSR